MPHPLHLVAAGAVILSPLGRLLMVQTHNRLGQGLILPGGMVEVGESPAAHWVEPSEAVVLHGQAGQSRMQAALSALVSGTPAYLET